MRSKQSFCRHTVSILPVTKRRRAFIFVLACLVWLNIIPTASGFISLQQQRGMRPNIVIDKVHKDHWVIHYSYGDDCPVERRNNDAALTAAVTEALQMWLQPLREYTDRPIVNDFRYKLSADWNAADFGITFHCHIGASTASVGRNQSPGIDERSNADVEQAGFMSSLLHEMGHIFGLADTYIPADKWGNPLLISKGGLDDTRGTQPASRMSGHLTGKDREPGLGTDDKNGIVYLYKVSYEGLSIFDCFFPDYERENPPLGCVPKRPLIFELKNGLEIHALWMLKEDEHLDLNARDTDGMTALHHAILNAYTEVVEILLAHPKIRVNIRSNDGRTPAQLARDMGRFQLTKRIWEHPTAKLPPWSVIPKGKLATTWGHLKKQY